MNGLSLFSGGGIGELYLGKLDINIVVANELIPRRAHLYNTIHRKSNMIIGDISDKDIYSEIVNSSIKNNIDFIIATPPCQGFSLVGKNKTTKAIQDDKRNYLFKYVLDIIKDIKPSYILIENIPRFLKLFIKNKKSHMNPHDYFNSFLGKDYIVHSDIYNSYDFGVPQDRRRAIIKIYKKGLVWNEPKYSRKKFTLKDAIGHLPSIESNQKSNIDWHYGRKHSENHILAMKKTPTGKSAFDYTDILKSTSGKTPKGFKTTYARMEWDKPCPTITMRNDAISSQRNVHPGVKLKNGEYSDARVLSIKELFLLTGLGDKFNLKKATPEVLIRQVIGESVPPKLIYQICKGIKK